MTGFTLMEVMVAGVLATFISLAIFQVIAQGVRMSDTMITKVVINTFAREAFWLLATGGVADVDNDGTLKIVSGFQGRRLSPIDADLLSVPTPMTNPTVEFPFNNTLRLSVSPPNDVEDYADLVRFVRTTSTTFLDVLCTAAGDPIASCAGAGEIDAQIGYVRRITVLSDVATSAVVIINNPIAAPPQIAGTHDIRLSIADPRRMDLFGDSHFTESQYIEEFRTSLSTRADSAVVPGTFNLNAP